MYYYEGHMGGIYTDKDYLGYDMLYCDQCGDSDFCLGEYDTFRDFLIGFANNISIYGRGGYEISYLMENFNDGSVKDMEEAYKIVETYVPKISISIDKLYEDLTEICDFECSKCPFDQKRNSFGQTCAIDATLYNMYSEEMEKRENE